MIKIINCSPQKKKIMSKMINKFEQIFSNFPDITISIGTAMKGYAGFFDHARKMKLKKQGIISFIEFGHQIIICRTCPKIEIPYVLAHELGHFVDWIINQGQSEEYAYWFEREFFNI